MEKLFRLQAPKTSARKEGLKQGEGRGDHLSSQPGPELRPGSGGGLPAH